MPRNPRSYLNDIIRCGDRILEKCSGKSFEEFDSDADLKDIVERNFISIGEALVQLKGSEEYVAEGITDVPHIIRFRNVLVHGYNSIDYKVVWLVVQDYLPKLVEEAKELH